MLPEFLVDRNLGTKIVPRLLQDEGWTIVTLADLYGERASQSARDEEWLTDAGERGLNVLMADKRIRHRTLEREALVAARVNAFCLTSGNLTGAAQAQQFLAHERSIMRAAAKRGPSLYLVSSAAIRAVPLD